MISKFLEKFGVVKGTFAIRPSVIPLLKYFCSGSKSELPSPSHQNLSATSLNYLALMPNLSSRHSGTFPAIVAQWYGAFSLETVSRHLKGKGIEKEKSERVFVSLINFEDSLRDLHKTGSIPRWSG